MRFVDGQSLVGGLRIFATGLLLAVLLCGGLVAFWYLVLFNHRTAPGG